MIKKQSLAKNYFFQFAYQIIVLIIPLIVSPYLTRVLGDTALGIYSYIHTFAYYFVMLAMLGISRHGVRIISLNSNDETKLRKAFWSLYSLHSLISVLSILLYLVFAFSFSDGDFSIYLIDCVYVASALFDITWFFYGLENFKSVVIKNAIVKMAECVLIFVFIKSAEDLWLYALITASSIFMGQLILIPQAIRIAKPIRFEIDDLKQHIKPLLVFFIAVLASTLYTAFDKTLLGLMDTKESVAYYEYSNMIVSVPKILIIVIGTVMFPRACKMAEIGDLEGQRRYINYSYIITSFIGMASMFGLFAVSKQFAVLYFGEEFAECGTIMIALSPIIYIVGVGEVIRTQYMIPNHMDVQFTASVIISALANIGLSLMLIPSMGVYGAVIGTATAELIGLCFQMFVCRKFIHFKDVFKYLFSFAFIGGLMFLLVEITKIGLNVGLTSLLIQILAGSLFFCLLSVFYIKFFEKEIWNLIVFKMRKLFRFARRK